MTILNLAEMQAAAAALPRAKDVLVGELGGSVRIQRLSTEACVALGSSFGKDAKPELRKAAMVSAIAASVIDADGGRVFSDSLAVDALDLPFGVVAQLFAEVATISGLFSDAATEELAKNS